MERERALLRSLVVRTESLTVGPAAMPTRSLTVPSGDHYFGSASVSPTVELRMPTGYTPPSSIPLENLLRAAAIIRAIPAQASNEDRHFLGQQAGKALEGRRDEPLQIIVPDVHAHHLSARRGEADGVVAQAVAVGRRLDDLQTRRDVIERRLASAKRESRYAEQQTLEKEYYGLLEQERRTQGELGQAEKRVVEVLVEVVQ